MPPPVPRPDGESVAGSPVVPPPQRKKSLARTQVAAQAPKYGINEAIALMRKLPKGDMRILAAVIKETLESTNINVSQIIADADEKESKLESKIQTLDTEIETYESQIKQRKEAIAIYLEDLEETRNVKNNLALAAEDVVEGDDGSHPEQADEPSSRTAESQSLQEENDANREGHEAPSEQDSENLDGEERTKSILLDALFGEDDSKKSS